MEKCFKDKKDVPQGISSAFNQMIVIFKILLHIQYSQNSFDLQ